ncbi:hypothetical protein ABPG73_008515 [Tetrahymena malaccensis]
MDKKQNESLMKKSQKEESNQQEEAIDKDIKSIKELKDEYQKTGQKEIIEQILQKIYQLPRKVKGLNIDDKWIEVLEKKNKSKLDDVQYHYYIFWCIWLERIFKKIEHIKDNQNDYDRNNIETINNYFECIQQIIVDGEIRDENHSNIEKQQEQDVNQSQKETKDLIKQVKFIFQKKQKKFLGIQTSDGIRDATLIDDKQQCGFKVSSKKFKDDEKEKEEERKKNERPYLENLFNKVADQFKLKVRNQWYYNYMKNCSDDRIRLEKNKQEKQEEQRTYKQPNSTQKEDNKKEKSNAQQTIDKEKENKIDKKQQQQKQENDDKEANNLFKSDGHIISLKQNWKQQQMQNEEQLKLQEEEQYNKIDFEKLLRQREEYEWHMRNKQALEIQQNLKSFQQTSQFAQNLGDDLMNVTQYKFQQEQGQIEKNAIQVLEVEIFYPDSKENYVLKKPFYLKYQYSCIEGESQKVLQLDEQYQIEDTQLEFYKSEDCIYMYQLQNNKPFCISQEIFRKRSETDLDIDDNIFSLEICIKTDDCDEDVNWGIYKLGFNEYLKNVEGNDHWLITQLKNPNDDKSIVFYAFLHLIIFDKQYKSYFDYLQNLKKNQLFFQCPFYNDCVNLPYFQPGQILLVYKLLSVFEYEKNFLGQYKYDEIEYEYVTQQHERTISQCYADIRTLYYFMYMSQASKFRANLIFQQQIWLKFEDKLFEINTNPNDQEIISDFYEICREGIPVEYRFKIWFENSSLFKKIQDLVFSLYDFCSDIHHLCDQVEEIQNIIKENWPSDIYYQNNNYIQIQRENIIYQKKDKIYKIISELSQASCIHFVPQMLLDLNMRFKSQTISKVQLSCRYNQIAQIIKDIILIGILDSNFQSEDPQGKKAGLKQISNLVYNQGLIDIVDKLITLNKKHKPNKYLQEYKIQHDIFWTVYCFYKDCLKNYVNSEFQGRQIINDLFVLNYCFKIFIQDLWDYLDSLYINTDFLFEKAFLSMFANLFSRELLYRIWDIIFLEISRKKIKPSWILISVAITILYNLKEMLFKATSIDDVIIIIRNYCSFETNYNQFIKMIYFWIDKIFYQHEEGKKDEVFDDQYLTEKIQIQADCLKQFNNIQIDQNQKAGQSKEKKDITEYYYQDEKHFLKLKNIPFSALYEKYQSMKSNLQNLFNETEVPKEFTIFKKMYGVLTNQPHYVHVVFHSFSNKLSENSEIQFIYKTSIGTTAESKIKKICYQSKQKNDEENWIQFQIDSKIFKENETLGKMTILINDNNLETQTTNTIIDRNPKKNKVQYKGYIEVDNLLHDQVVKLNIQMQERIVKANQTFYIPTGYIVECSVIVQTCNSYNIIPSLSKRVSFYYLKNIGKKITEDQKDTQYLAYKHQIDSKIIEFRYHPFYLNFLFEKELQQNVYYSKLDFYNVDMINQWKLNSLIPKESQKEVIEKILPSKFNQTELDKLIEKLSCQNNQFYLLDLFLICIIYCQESFPSKASLIFKYLNLFERRRCQKNILDITVKSFLIGFYDKIKYFFPSHHVIAIENYFKSKAVSQINRVVFVFYKIKQHQKDLTEFFKKEIFDKVFEKNLFHNLDLSNPDLLKLLYFKLDSEIENFQKNKLPLDGKLIIDYQQKSFQRQKQIKLTVDWENKTFIIKKSLIEKQRINMSLKDKKQELFQRLLKLQKYQINFEVYDTYTEQEFVDLLNQMPLVPLLLTVKNCYQKIPLSVERITRNLSTNLNIQLQVKIQVDNEFQYQNKAILVRDVFFNLRENYIQKKNSELQFYLPSINSYSRLENIANSLLNTLVLDNKIRAIVFDRGNGVKIHSENYLKFDYEIYFEEGLNKRINFPKQNSFYDFEKFKQHKELSNLMIHQVSKSNSENPQINKYSLIINILTQQRNVGQTQNIPTYFCKYKNENIDEQSVFLPVVYIQKRQDQKYIVKLQSLQNQQFIVQNKELYSILETDETSDEYFNKTFENYSNI